jgi:hypothetical protein
MSDSFFGAMSARDITFYDPRRNVARTAKTVRFRARLRRKSIEAIGKFLLEVRGFGFSDY